MTYADDLPFLDTEDTHNHAVDQSADDFDENGPDENAPWGYMIDPVTLERRPKKRPGRQKVATPVPSPSIEQLTPIDRPQEDRAPERSKARKKAQEKEQKPETPAPPFRAGPIAKGMNGLYRKAGKIIRSFDPEIGKAVIACTRKEDEDDVTVGEAWEELARVNPRIRAFLMKLLTGGAWTQIFVAHLPIFMAIIMKDSIRKHIPLMGLVGSFLNDEDDEPDETQGGLDGLLSGMTQDDMNQAMAFASQMMGGMATDVQRSRTGRVVTADNYTINED